MTPERGAPVDEPHRGERFFGEGATESQQRYAPRAATVAIARTTERHRDAESIAALTRQAIDLLGGIATFVKPGQRVLIKPQLLCSVMLDHFGWVGFTEHTAGLGRIAGCVLMVAGFFLIARF